MVFSWHLQTALCTLLSLRFQAILVTATDAFLFVTIPFFSCSAFQMCAFQDQVQLTDKEQFGGPAITRKPQNTVVLDWCRPCIVKISSFPTWRSRIAHFGRRIFGILSVSRWRSSTCRRHTLLQTLMESILTAAPTFMCMIASSMKETIALPSNPGLMRQESNLASLARTFWLNERPAEATDFLWVVKLQEEWSTLHFATALQQKQKQLHMW